MGSSALRYSGAAGRNVRSPLLKLQSDERLVNMVRKGNQGAFEVLVARYHARLLSFCRHMLGSREDAEDVLQEVLTASYNAILADERPINVRPWLYRIARNRCLNHLRRNRAVGVDSMDIHLAEHGATTADKVHEREEFRQLLHDIRDLPETQRTALVLREMDALSYEQIAEAMETTVSSVKSLLVRARVSLTEAAEARLLSCDEVREELAEIAEGMRRKQSPSVRRHVKNCARCEIFQGEMKKSSRALAALAPVGPFALLYKLVFAHAASHSAGSAGIAGAAGAGGAGGAGAGAAGAGAAGAGAAGTAGVAAGAAGAAGGAGSAGLVTAGVGAVATKAAAGIAAAALVTAGTVAIDHNGTHRHAGPSGSVLVQRSLTAGLQNAIGSSHLGGSVGAGPGLSVAVISSKLATGARNHIAGTATVSTASQTTATVIHAPQESGPDKTSVASKTPPTQVVNPPLIKLQGAPPEGTTNGANLSSTGGSGLSNAGGPSSNPSAPTTGTSTMPTTGTSTMPTTGTSTTSTTVTTSTTGSTPTTTSTTVSTAPTTTSPAVDPTTGTVTAPTETTTAPTGTTTAPTETTTAPTGTTTAPTGTTTAPADTSTGASTTPTPPSSTSGS